MVDGVVLDDGCGRLVTLDVCQMQLRASGCIGECIVIVVERDAKLGASFIQFLTVAFVERVDPRDIKVVGDAAHLHGSRDAMDLHASSVVGHDGLVLETAFDLWVDFRKCWRMDGVAGGDAVQADGVDVVLIVGRLDERVIFFYDGAIDNGDDAHGTDGVSRGGGRLHVDGDECQLVGTHFSIFIFR